MKLAGRRGGGAGVLCVRPPLVPTAGNGDIVGDLIEQRLGARCVGPGGVTALDWFLRRHTVF